MEHETINHVSVAYNYLSRLDFIVNDRQPDGFGYPTGNETGHFRPETAAKS